MLLTLQKRKIAFPEKSQIVTESFHVDRIIGEIIEHLGLEIPGVEVVVTEEN